MRAVLGIAILGSIIPPQTYSEEVTQSAFDTNYSDHENYQTSTPSTQTISVPNVRQQIRISLDTSSSNEELIILDIVETESGAVTLTARHTIALRENTLIGNILVSVPGPTPIDLPLPINSEANRLANRNAQYIAFVPDNCNGELILIGSQIYKIGSQIYELSDCMLIGKNRLTFPQSVDLRSGFLIVGYMDGNRLRSVSFRLHRLSGKDWELV